MMWCQESKTMVFFIIFSLVVALDQISKYLVVNKLVLYAQYEVINGLFNIVYVTNSGAAFGFLSGETGAWKHYFFITIGLIALIGILIAYHNLSKKHYLYPISLPLIAGGALGNMIDRIRFGSVIDFLDFYYAGYHFPAFNIADSSICIGVALFFYASTHEKDYQGRLKI